MVYGAEAVLPHDLKFGAPRISGYEEEEVEEALQDDKYTADEARDTTIEGQKDTRTSCTHIKAAACGLELSTKETSSYG